MVRPIRALAEVGDLILSESRKHHPLCRHPTSEQFSIFTRSRCSPHMRDRRRISARRSTSASAGSCAQNGRLAVDTLRRYAYYHKAGFRTRAGRAPVACGGAGCARFLGIEGSGGGLSRVHRADGTRCDDVSVKGLANWRSRALRAAPHFARQEPPQAPGVFDRALRGRSPNLIYRKDPETFRGGIDPAWWCVPIIIAIAVGVLLLIFEFDRGKLSTQPFFPRIPQEDVERSPEKPDPGVQLAEGLKNEPKKDAAVTQPPEMISPYEAAVRQHQKGQ